MTRTRHVLLATVALAAFQLSPTAHGADGKQIETTTLDVIVAANPLPAGGPTAKVISTARAGNSELQVIRISKIRLHHHAQEDHVVYVARGNGTARLENAVGQIDSRPARPGDVFNLPRGKKHAFERTGDEDLVLLVVATAGWKPLEDTVFHE